MIQCAVILSSAILRIFRIRITLLSIVLSLFYLIPTFAQEGKKGQKSELGHISPAENEAFFGAGIPRTMSLLALSNENRRYPVKILVFGQSVSRQGWWKILEDKLRKRFPFAQITIENQAISGFSASQLVRSAIHNLYPYYPDLVIFHDYGGKYTGEWERMVENIRRYTTAEILLWTDHLGQNDEVGSKEFNERLKQENNASDVIRYVARKYNCELADVRKEWKIYLNENNLEPRELLTDNVHLNEKGESLLAALITRHFRLNTLIPAGWTDMVQTYEAKRAFDEGKNDGIIFSGSPWRKTGASAVGSSQKSSLKLTFEGNRVDVIVGNLQSENLGTAKILIDGKPPSEHSQLYSFTLPSPAHEIYWQPAIRRIDSNTKLLIEDWRLKITKISDDAENFTFTVYGSKTGYDGTGEFNGDKYKFGKWGDIMDYQEADNYPDKFISNSGRIVIDHRDFKITWAQQYSKKKCPVGFEIKWKVIPLFIDTYVPPISRDNSYVNTITIAKGFKNCEHTLEIIPNGDGLVPIEAVQVHRPPLR